jgi:gluconolactonase
MSWDIADYQIIATGYNGRPLNSPNDVVVHSNGMIYFSDPAFGRRPGLHGYFGRQQQPCQGIYSIHPETLQVVLVTDELDNPNGLCFSPDESKMYFAETSISQLTVMDVLKDGSLGNKKLFSYSVNKGHGTPDGIKVDVDGNVWCTAEGGIQVFNIEGTILGLIYTPEVSGNLCFGGKGMNTLFIGSGSNLFTVLLKAKGQSLRR